jgi:hypothetical protein
MRKHGLNLAATVGSDQSGTNVTHRHQEERQREAQASMPAVHGGSIHDGSTLVAC